MKKFKLFLFASAALLPAVPAYAQESQDDENSIVVADVRIVDIVVVASGVGQEEKEIGRAVTVIKRDEIERRQTVVLSDLLATTPGVTMTRNGGIGGFTGVRIRGAEGEQTLTLIDGVRINDPSSPGGGFDFANLLSGAVDRVEILRGPNSVVWGSQAIGGVVNVSTAAPVEGLAGHAQAEYGSFDSGFANAGISGGTGSIRAALNGGYLRTDGISAAAGGAEPDGYKQYGATGRVDIDIGDAVGVDLRGYYAHSRTELDGFSFSPPYGLIDDPEYSTGQEVYGYAGVHANLFDGDFRNRAAFTLADINRDNYDPTFGSAPSFIGRGRSERYEYQGDYKVTAQLRLVGGAEHEDSRFTDGFTFASTGITSFYGEAIVTPVRVLTLTAGVRHDDHKRFGGHTTFAGSAALALDSGTTLRASYDEGFKAPTLFQLFGDFGTVSLRPETARSYDLGVEQWFLSRRARVRATWFHRDTVNQIDFISCPPAQVTDPATICFHRPFGTYDNIARTRAQGVELELELRPVDDLTIAGQYSYIDAKNRSPGPNLGNELARRPHQSASLSADYKLPFGLSLGGTVQVVGHSFDDGGNFTRLGGYTLAGIRAAMAVNDRIELYARVDNLFDEQYQTVAGYGTLGRAAYAGVRLKFD
jgi:vitamin B12 transporter